MQWFPRARKSGGVMSAGSDLTKAGSFVGRLGPLAVALSGSFLWLASPAAGWVSGQTIQVAGGGARSRILPR